MKPFIPQDVINYIFVFLFFSSVHEKLFCLSKFTTKNLKNILEYKIFLTYIESINMMREDKHKFIAGFSYEKKWLKYYKYRWPKVIKETCETNHELCEYKLGEYVDAKDFINAWCPARIINIHIKYKYKFNEKNVLEIIKDKNLYEVEFLGWSHSYNEKLDNNKLRNLTTYTTNPKDKMNNLKKKCFKPFWCLVKDENIWKMERIIERMTDISNNLLIISCNSKIYKISKENIDDIISPISNAICFLAKTNLHEYDYTCRNFYL